jgi:hypothetical protein
MLNLCHTLGNDLQWSQVYHTYLASECSTDTVFINREHMDWGPAKQHSDLTKAFLYLPSPQMSSPTTIISIET